MNTSIGNTYEVFHFEKSQTVRNQKGIFQRIRVSINFIQLNALKALPLNPNCPMKCPSAENIIIRELQ